MAGGSAVIGILKALLTAETGEYSAAMAAAGASAQELGKKLEKDLEPRQRTINKLVSEFLGGNEIRRAQEYAAAVEKLGGVTNLTAADQLKVNRAVNDALGHYQALGTQAPKNLTDLEQATRKVESAWDKADQALGKFGLSLRVVSLAGLTAGLLKGAKDAIAFGSNLTDLSAATGLTVQELQRLNFAGAQVGVGMEQIARGVQKLQRELVDGDKGTVAAVTKLGLSIEGLLAMSPGAMFEAMAREIAKLPEPAQRTAAAVELLGRSGADLLPLLLADIDKLQKGFVGMSDAAVKAADDFDDAWAKAKIGFTVAIGQILEGFTSLEAAMKLIGRSGLTGGGNTGRDFAEGLIDAVDQQVAGMVKAADAASTYGTKLGALVGPASSADAALKEFNKTGTPLEQMLKKAAAAAEALRASIVALARELSGDSARDEIKKMDAAVRALQKTGRDISADELPAFVKQLDKLTTAGHTLTPKLQAIYDKNRLLAGTLPTTVSLFEQWAKVTERVEDETDLLSVVLKGLPPGTSWFGDVPLATTELSDLGKELVSKVDQVNEAKTAFAGFSDDTRAGMDALVFGLDAIAGATTGATQKVVKFAADFVAAMAAAQTASAAAWAGFTLGASLAISENIRRNKDLNDSIKETQDSIKRLFEITRTNDMAANLALLGLTIDDLKGMKLNEWADVVQAAFDRLDAAMERAGLSLADLEDPADTFSGLAQQLADDMAQLIARGFTLTQITKGNAAALNEVLAAAFNTGGKIPEALAPMMRTLITSGLLSDDLRRKFLGLADPVPWKDMEAIANEFGLDLAALGPKFAEAKLGETAEAFAQKFLLLVNNGADVNSVLEKMGPHAQKFFLEAQKWGLELPESMKPLLAKMIELGTLVDKDGNKITSLSQIKFGKTLADELEPLLAALNKLIDVLTNKVPHALTSMMDAANVQARRWPTFTAPTVPNGFGVGDHDSGSGGGAPASFASPMSFASSMPSVSAASMGSRGGTMAINVMMDGRSVARAAVPFIPESVSNIGLRAR